MQTDRIVALLTEERNRINAAIQALEGQSAGRRAAVQSQTSKPSGRRRGPRRMSAEARRRISEAQKKRWAAFKKK